jgi:hypothetical protein
MSLEALVSLKVLVSLKALSRHSPEEIDESREEPHSDEDN